MFGYFLYSGGYGSLSEEFGMDHWMVAKRAMRYFERTKSYKKTKTIGDQMY